MNSSSSSGPLRVAVVDDSSFVRKAISRMLENDERIDIVGQAASGEELLTHLLEWAPDAITLDLSMPGMGGLQTLDRVMAVRPTPVIILSTHSAKDAPLTIEALHRGAMDFIDKQQYSLVDFESLRAVILEKLLSVRSASLPSPRRGGTGEQPAAKTSPRSSKPTARGKLGKSPQSQSQSRSRTGPQSRAQPRTRGEAGAVRRAPVQPSPRFDVLLVGASTGGPPTIQKLLEDLGATVSVPVLVVQHMPKGFTRAFADRLNSHLEVSVREASDGERLELSTVYLAPAGMHLRVARREDQLFAQLTESPRHLTHRPSVDVLFESAARVVGRRCLAALLTGMGSDGAQGMARIADAGGYTVVQDMESCVVYGMPRAAKNLRAVREELSLDVLGGRLQQLLGAPQPGSG
ncbi:MAG: chemotaxis-specific protein-glutamate methyltransferase CheB [Acidobacteriota bacterium]